MREDLELFGTYIGVDVGSLISTVVERRDEWESENTSYRDDHSGPYRRPTTRRT